MAASAVIAVRSPQLCGPLGLCSTQQGASATEKALQAANQAEQDLRRAQGIEEYRQATDQLEHELLKLTGDILTPEQKQNREQLQFTAKKARSILTEEEAGLSRLDRAIQALDAAESLNGGERLGELETAGQALDGIPPSSFSAAEAVRLRKRQLELERSATPPQAAEPEPVEPGSAPEPSSLSTPATEPAQRRAATSQPTPKPTPQRQTPSASGNSASFRDEPLF
ncbi:hypothetical protein KBZ18_10275 [Synechococcus sp. Cruz-9H2]|uniref:hypothetical protein n=1 Tax=unclassified Synechococcus TaxID=2626047 RepID=UPI0020CBD458|nr:MULTISPECIES: hypothetical protein [unclassified Synechococcus]MCP9819879.1 hypothetical protein [Synechococcus sp. Cruz-9H2]MCP9856309.1 hypothetical protein [Synechococcus sp. Cruz-9C9]